MTGFLLAGVGHRTAEGSNFLIVKQDTPLTQVEEAFKTFSQRADVGIILINQHVANDIRHVLKDYNATIPTVLEIPSKEHPYDPEQDYIMVSGQPRFSKREILECDSLSIEPTFLVHLSTILATCQHVLGWWWNLIHRNLKIDAHRSTKFIYFVESI